MAVVNKSTGQCLNRTKLFVSVGWFSIVET